MYDLHVRVDPPHLGNRHSGIPAAHALGELVGRGRRRLGEIDQLEQPVDGIADLGGMKPPPTLPSAPRGSQGAGFMPTMRSA